jgi:hypothetical protein
MLTSMHSMKCNELTQQLYRKDHFRDEEVIYHVITPALHRILVLNTSMLTIGNALSSICIFYLQRLGRRVGMVRPHVHKLLKL